MTPEPRLIETLTEKRDRRTIEAKSAWADHEAHKLAVDANMARLRDLRLAREAEQAVLDAQPKAPAKRVRKRKKVLVEAAN
jgi:hypothetical protein